MATPGFGSRPLKVECPPAPFSRAMRRGDPLVALPERIASECRAKAGNNGGGHSAHRYGQNDRAPVLFLSDL